MPNQRAAGKRMLGAQVEPALYAAVDKWLEKHKADRVSVTDFLTLACVEKLEREGIPIDRQDVFVDRRVRFAQRARAAATLNDANSKPPDAGKSLLRKHRPSSGKHPAAK